MNTKGSFCAVFWLLIGTVSCRVAPAEREIDGYKAAVPNTFRDSRRRCRGDPPGDVLAAAALPRCHELGPSFVAILPANAPDAKDRELGLTQKEDSVRVKAGGEIRQSRYFESDVCGGSNSLSCMRMAVKIIEHRVQFPYGLEFHGLSRYRFDARKTGHFQPDSFPAGIKQPVGKPLASANVKVTFDAMSKVVRFSKEDRIIVAPKQIESLLRWQFAQANRLRGPEQLEFRQLDRFGIWT